MTDMMDKKKWPSAIRFLVVGLIAAAGCACSQSSEQAAPPAAAAAPPAETTAPTAAPAAAPAGDNAPLPENLVARLVRADSPVLGRANAPVTIVEFLDPACEACRAFAPVVKQLLFLHPEDVRVVVRYAAFHPGSAEAIQVLEASRKQGKFAEVLTALFDRQDEWAAHGAPNPERAWDIAGENGVNVARARKNPSASSVANMLNRESDDIVAIRVERTPTFFVNGKPLPAYGVQELMDLVAAEVRRVKPTP
jgi:protein-disulfide isomerase